LFYEQTYLLLIIVTLEQESYRGNSKFWNTYCSVLAPDNNIANSFCSQHEFQTSIE